MARIVAMSRIHTMDSGIRIFQPSAMSWSYRIRGSVPRSQMKQKSRMKTLMRNHSTGHQPVFDAGQIVEIGAGARQPPRKSVVASAGTVVMLMYSARKNMANFIDEYSVV